MTATGTEGEREAPGKVTLVANADDLNTVIEILDANLEPVRLRENLSEVEVELDPGVYTVQFRAGDALAEKQVVLRPGSPLKRVELSTAEAPQFSSAVPLARTSSTREVDQDAARSLSRADPITLPGHAGGSHLMVFIRDPSGGAGQSVDGGLELRDPAGGLLAKFTEIGEHKPEHRQSGVHVNLDPGVYRLALNVGGGVRLEQSIATAAGWQTQVFLTVDDFGSSDELLPNLWDMSVMFAHAHQGFDPNSPDARYTELALRALEGGDAVPASDRRAMYRGKFQNPMLGILALHLHLKRKKINPDLTKEVLGNLINLAGPIPDIISLALACEARLDAQQWPGHLAKFLDANLPLREPPMLREGWRYVVEASNVRKDIIEPGSLAEEISGCLAASGPWLIWRGDLAVPATEIPDDEVLETASADTADPGGKPRGFLGNVLQALAQWSLDGVIRMLSRALSRQGETYELLQSGQVTEAERRVAYFVRPILEPSLWTIMQQFPGLTRRFQDQSPEGESRGEALVRELQVPAGTAFRLCWATWWKFASPVLPDKNRLSGFVNGESHNVAMLKRVLRSLAKLYTGVRHARLEREINGLEMLYLRYWNAPMRRKKSPSAEDLAGILNDAGYRTSAQNEAGRSNASEVTAAHIDALLEKLRSTIRSALKRTRSDRQLVDEILASGDVIVAPDDYRRGHLFPVSWQEHNKPKGGAASTRL